MKNLNKFVAVLTVAGVITGMNAIAQEVVSAPFSVNVVEEEPVVVKEEGKTAEVENKESETAQEVQETEEQVAEQQEENTIVQEEEPVEVPDAEEETAEEETAEGSEEQREEETEAEANSEVEEMQEEELADEQIIEDENTEHYVEITVDVPEGAVIESGTVVTFHAKLYGYENEDYTVQWQVSADGSNYSDIPGENGLSYSIAITAENASYCWRVEVNN